MFDIFLYAFTAIMPIILLIILGYILRQKRFLSDDFLKGANSFVFKVALPVLLFYNVYRIESFQAIDWTVVWYSLIVIMVIFLLGLAFVILFIKDSKKKGVLLQCIFRSNFSIIGIPLAEALGGLAGLSIVSILSAFTIPLFNILAVISLSLFVKNEDGTKVSVKDMILKIVKNPLILGVFAGLICLGIRELIPTNTAGELVFSLQGSLTFFYKALEMLAKIASPLALIVLGGLFSFNAMKGMLKEILFGSIGRLLVAPLIGIGFAVLLSKTTNLLKFDETVYPALIALFASPVATTSAIMAGEMKNDEQLASQLVVWTSLGSIITIFVFVVVLRSMSLI